MGVEWGVEGLARLGKRQRNGFVGGGRPRDGERYHTARAQGTTLGSTESHGDKGSAPAQTKPRFESPCDGGRTPAGMRRV